MGGNRFDKLRAYIAWPLTGITAKVLIASVLLLATLAAASTFLNAAMLRSVVACLPDGNLAMMGIGVLLLSVVTSVYLVWMYVGNRRAGAKASKRKLPEHQSCGGACRSAAPRA